MRRRLTSEAKALERGGTALTAGSGREGRLRRFMLAALAVPVLTGLPACLEPGDAIYSLRDTDPPEVLSTTPVAGGTVAPGGTLRITFSETMDPRTLRPGIAVFTGRDEVALTVAAPAVSDVDADVERGDRPYTVEATAAAGSPLQPATAYTLVLRDSLTDLEGNPLTGEVRVAFRTTTGP
jgi:hypothetical protein